MSTIAQSWHITLVKWKKSISSSVNSGKIHTKEWVTTGRSLSTCGDLSTGYPSDIDYIQIRSDTETARGNRSYNYRVMTQRHNIIHS